jgi:hypothetical protein
MKTIRHTVSRLYLRNLKNRFPAKQDLMLNDFESILKVARFQTVI